MEWTRAKRYQPYTAYSAATLLALQQQAADSPAQLRYHIRPRSGLLNDPNGFSYFNGEWNVFYQSFPFGATHGLKAWMRLTSPDLVHWYEHGLALQPDTKFDSHGAYSGSARAVGDRLFLMYTGNHRTATWQRQPYQLGAWLDQKGQVTKLAKPLIEPPAAVSEHFRDPQLLQVGSTYYALIGAQTASDQHGAIWLYQAPAAVGPWQAVGPVDLGEPALGYMVECPNLVEVDGTPVMIFCPQGLPKQVAAYQNIYPNMYVSGTAFDYQTAQLRHPSALNNLDAGFDVYASQAFNAPDGKAYLISWVGLPDLTYPTDQENWANCLSQVKELHFHAGHLYQQPVAAMKTLRQTEHGFAGSVTTVATAAGQQLELQLTIAADQTGTLYLAADDTLTHGLRLNFDTRNGQLEVDRGQTAQVPAPEYGTTRSVAVPAHQPLQLRIFLDHSLAEIFVNHGAEVVTLRYFNDQAWGQIAFAQPTQVTGKWWPLQL